MTMSRKRATTVLLMARERIGRNGDNDNIPTPAEIQEASQVLGYNLGALCSGPDKRDVRFGKFAEEI